LPRLDKFAEGTQKSLAQARAELSAAQQGLSAAQADLRGLMSKQPTNVQEKQFWDPQVSRAQALGERFVQRITKLQKQIPLYQARLAAVPEMRGFIESLHSRATIHFALCAECGARDLVLARAGSLD